MTELYRPLYRRDPIVFHSRRTSELIKYAPTPSLALKITLHQRDRRPLRGPGRDVQHVAKGIGLDRRIGGKFLNAGPLRRLLLPKDTLALVRTATTPEPSMPCA